MAKEMSQLANGVFLSSKMSGFIAKCVRKKLAKYELHLHKDALQDLILQMRCKVLKKAEQYDAQKGNAFVFAKRIILNEMIDWRVQEAKYKTYILPMTEKVIRQMTDAWQETLHLQNLRNALLRKIGTDENTTMRSVALECAAYAEHALEHWKILAGLLATTMEGVAEAMEREGARLRKIGWIAPQRPCWKDYRSLVDLVKAR